MATHIPTGELDLQEQIARIREMGINSDRMHAETQKLLADQTKVLAETEFMPRTLIFQAMLATAALLGAGAAIAKLFFP